MSVESVSYKRSWLIGMLLGKAVSKLYVDKNSQKCKAKFIVTGNEEQSDFVAWKAQEARNLLRIRVDYNSSIDPLTFSLVSGRRIRVIHEWFYRDHHKVITPKIRFMDHPIGLAMLLCDVGKVLKRKKYHRDGSVYCLKPSIVLMPHCSNMDGAILLMNHIKDLCGASSHLIQGRRYPQISFNVESSKQLWFYVKDWIPQLESLKIKFADTIECYGI
ncbi:MAG: hypothetical protein BWK79_16595 [Beggiatoa sp. IS2]|nr:MAG: hypothetical protein BWK79_16595 [Beggiatoa sp. IS2]